MHINVQKGDLGEGGDMPSEFDDIMAIDAFKTWAKELDPCGQRRMSSIKYSQRTGSKWIAP